LSLLNDEQRAGVLAQLQGDEPEAVTEEPQAFDEAHEEVEEDAVEMQQEEDVEEEQSGHAVPYSRFSQVIAARNDLAEQNSNYETRVQELESKLASMKGLRELLGQQEQSQQEEYYQEEVSEIDGIRASVQQIAEQQQYQLLERELAAASEQFPSVSNDYLLQAVIDDPSINILETAAAYASHVGEIEEAAIARYLESNQADAATPDVPPELGNAGRTPSSKQANRTGASNIREVTEFLLKKGF
jgi:hypothetical protein